MPERQLNTRPWGRPLQGRLSRKTRPGAGSSAPLPRRCPPAPTHPGHPPQGCHPDSPARASLSTHPHTLSRCPSETCTGHLLWFPPGDTSCVVLSAPARCPCPLGCWLSSSPPHTRGQPHFSEVTGSTLGSGHLPLLLTTSQPPRGHPGGTRSRRRGGPRVRRGQAGARRARCRWVAHLSVLG